MTSPAGSGVLRKLGTAKAAYGLKQALSAHRSSSSSQPIQLFFPVLEGTGISTLVWVMSLAHAASLHNLGGRNQEGISKLINLCRAENSHWGRCGMVRSRIPQWPCESDPESPRMIFGGFHLTCSARLYVQKDSQPMLRIEIQFEFHENNDYLCSRCVLPVSSPPHDSNQINQRTLAFFRGLSSGQVRSLAVNRRLLSATSGGEMRVVEPIVCRRGLRFRPLRAESRRFVPAIGAAGERLPSAISGRSVRSTDRLSKRYRPLGVRHLSPIFDCSLK